MLKGFQCYRFFQIIVSVSLLLIGVQLSSCENDQKDKQKPKEYFPLVKTYQITKALHQRTRIFPGHIIATKQVDLSFPVAGTLITITVHDGQLVKKDEVLAKLDPADFQASVDAANAKYRHAKRQYMRMKSLLKSGTIAQVTLDQAQAAMEVSLANVQVAQKALNDTNLKATFDGMIGKTYVENYQTVQKKQKILSLIDVDDVDVVIMIPEQDVIKSPKQQSIQFGEDVRGKVVFDALPNKTFKVKLKEYATQADPDTQTYRVILTMPAPSDVRLLPGMTASYIIEPTGRVASSKILIPSHCVQYGADGKAFVWIYNKTQQNVHQKPVRVGELVVDSVEILSGLSLGDTIISAGFNKLAPDMKVRIDIEAN